MVSSNTFAPGQRGDRAAKARRHRVLHYGIAAVIQATLDHVGVAPTGTEWTTSPPTTSPRSARSDVLIGADVMTPSGKLNKMPFIVGYRRSTAASTASCPPPTPPILIPLPNSHRPSDSYSCSNPPRGGKLSATKFVLTFFAFHRHRSAFVTVRWHSPNMETSRLVASHFIC
jgi:hypothetical protein